MYDKLRKIRQSRAEDDRGFTLIELLVVVVIIGILIAIAIPLYLNYQKGAHDKAAQSDLKSAVATLQQCYTENSNAYPSATTDYTITQGTSIVFTCGTETETANLSDGTNVAYTSTDGTSFTLKAWNTGGHKNTADKAYSYNSADGGKIE